MQAQFKLDSWLIETFSTFELIDFTNTTFEASISNLIRQLDNLKSSHNNMSNINLDLSNDCKLQSEIEIEIQSQAAMFNETDFNNIDHENRFESILINSRLYTIEEIPYIEAECINSNDTRINLNKNEIQNIEIKHASKWSNQELTEWVEKQNFTSDIIQLLKYFDGEVFEQLFLLKSQAPEYFYKVVSNNSNIPFENVAKLVIKMNQEFKN